MKKSLILLGAGALIVAVASGVVQAQKDSTSNNMKSVIYAAAANATFKSTPMGGVSMAALWGDMDKGPHATFTKFEPGYDAGMHTHTNDVWIVGIKGAYLYKMKRAKSVWGREISSEFRAATSIGAAVTRRKARSFMRRRQGSSIPSLQNRGTCRIFS